MDHILHVGWESNNYSHEQAAKLLAAPSASSAPPQVDLQTYRNRKAIITIANPFHKTQIDSSYSCILLAVTLQIVLQLKTLYTSLQYEVHIAPPKRCLHLCCHRTAHW